MALELAEDLRNDFAERDKLFNLIDAVVFLEQEVKIPENYKQTAVEVRTPYAMHIANSITSALSINAPKVIFKPIEFGDSGEDAAAYRSRFFEASWKRQQLEKRRNLYRTFMYDEVTKGIAVLKTFERKQRAWAKYVSKGIVGEEEYTPGYAAKLADELDRKLEKGELDEDSRSRLYDVGTEEYKRGLPYPIETTVIPPETFYYQQGEDGLVRVAEVKEVPYYETLKRYGATFTTNQKISLDTQTGLALPDTQWHRVYPSGTTKRRTIRMVEMWDPEFCTIILQGPGDIPAAGSGMMGSGCVVKRYQHSYGDPVLQVLKGPYFPAYGVQTSSRQPHKASLSVLYAYLHLFPLLNSLLTMQSQAAFSFAYPAYRRTTQPTFGVPENPFGMDATDLVGQRERIVPGAIFPHDVAPMDQPRTTVDLDKAIQLVRGMIEMALPDTVQGNVTGEMAGYTLNQAARMASLQWSPIVENVQNTLAERIGWESHLIESHIGETVYVWGSIPQPRRRRNSPRTYKDGWMGIGPKELKGFHTYEVELKPVSVSNDQLELRVIRDELDMRLIDPSEAIRKRGRNPVEVERAWMLHELKNDDEIRKNMRQRVFQSLSTIDQEGMRRLPPGGEPGGTPPVETSPLPGGAQPGISQGLPTTGFVPPAGATPAAPPPAAVPQPMNIPRPPGTTPGSPSPIRGVPQQAEPIPGGG